MARIAYSVARVIIKENPSIKILDKICNKIMLFLSHVNNLCILRRMLCSLMVITPNSSVLWIDSLVPAQALCAVISGKGFAA